MADEAGVKISKDVAALINKAAASFEPTEAALLYAGERQKTRILERTARGVDIDGQPFAPYNTTRPYYWYPSAGLKNPQAAKNRFANKTGGGRTGFGVKFANYAAYKLQGLGRAAVDLMGPRAPHMLQAIVIKVSAGLLTIGIYGDEAKRASAHNEGTKNMPRRHFLGASDADKSLMNQDVFEYGRKSLREALLAKFSPKGGA